jgi:hypothetical protein
MVLLVIESDAGGPTFAWQMTRRVFLFLSAFLASGVEMVEALTVVLIGSQRRGAR